LVRQWVVMVIRSGRMTPGHGLYQIQTAGPHTKLLRQRTRSNMGEGGLSVCSGSAHGAQAPFAMHLLHGPACSTFASDVGLPLPTLACTGSELSASGVPCSHGGSGSEHRAQANKGETPSMCSGSEHGAPGSPAKSSSTRCLKAEGLKTSSWSARGQRGPPRG